LNAQRPLPPRSKKLLWSAFAGLTGAGLLLVGGMILAIVSKTYLLTIPLGALLILLLWRAEHWLMAWHRHLRRRGAY
jgi:choline-glycine betaine transporter